MNYFKQPEPPPPNPEEGELFIWTNFRSIMGGGASSDPEIYHQGAVTAPFHNFELLSFTCDFEKPGCDSTEDFHHGMD